MTRQPTRPTISAVLIVKDEEDVLDSCLSALGWVDEILVYDTGSTDRTREIAATYTDRVIEGYWDDDFGGARTRALDHATGDWAFTVDADEVVTGDVASLRKQVEAAGNLDRFVVTVHSGAAGEVQHGGEVVNVRLFVRDRYRYSGRLHEQVVPRPGQEGRLGGVGAIRNVRLTHSGYSVEAMSKHDKAQRNLAIARQDVEGARERSADPVALAAVEANLARALAGAGQNEEALELGERLRAEGRVPGGTMALLAQTMAGASALLGDDASVDRWLDTWEAVDYSPIWARAARVRFTTGRGQAREALELLEQIPTTAVDAFGRRFVKHELAAVQVALLVERGRLTDAVRVAVDAARAGYPSVSPDELVLLLTEAGRPLSTIVTALSERIWRHYAVWCTQDPTPRARTFLYAMLEARPGDLAVMLCAAGAARAFDLEELAVWAAQLRRAGLADLCPLVTVAGDSTRDVRTRTLAAAMAVGIFDDARALPDLEAALGEVAPEDEATLMAELDVLVPGLVTAA